ncbi:olfactory receptor 52K1-like [Phyllobates terribilis]|uniref:olfactory receptor 52K1-like n=1 Tax=Phyllobates terribilis TaxID=111132 RepID=UPI003CCABBD9
MENMSIVGRPFVFLGLLELERHWIPYSIVALILYIITTFLCCLIVYVIWAEASLHEPMYLFICNLLLNAVFGSTVVFPQFIVNLLSGCSTISFPECLFQTFCVQSFSTVEILTFAAMAYDRYLAVGNPLRYSSIMTNMKALTYISMIWVFSFVLVMLPVVMTANLHLCGVTINNIFCENMSLLRLACGNSLVNNLVGLVESLLFLVCLLLIIIYCYVRTMLICLKLSRSSSLKAIHTLVTHIISFSIFMTATLFVFLRYRLSSGAISVAAHVLLSVTGLLTSAIVNPIVYGIRTETLKLKLIHNLQNINVFKKFSQLN